MPERIQRRRTKGWHMPKGAVYVGRPTRWGNPWTVADAEAWGVPSERWHQFAVDRYREDVERGVGDMPRLAEIRAQLAGKDLVCWCPIDQPCHADFLLQVANVSQRLFTDLARPLLGCEWGRAVWLADDRAECREYAVQRVPIQGGPREGTYLVQLCPLHRDLVLAHSDPHGGA